ncbi:MAG: NAD-dependent epimerase/dehydratase family protein, partial [Clostridia bacterium]
VNQQKTPFSTDDDVSHPISLYAATKKSNELMAYIVKGESIKIFNNGDMKRDFTYVDDIVQGIDNMLDCPPEGDDPAAVYNIGNNKPEDLLYFVETLEKCLMNEGIIQSPAVKEFLPMQAGDVYQTYADVEPLMHNFGFKPSTPIEVGLSRFAKWYKEYYTEGKH